MSDAEMCDNCGQPIGRLERAFLYQNHVVCGDCHRRLAVAVPPTLVPANASSSLDRPVHTERKRKLLGLGVILGSVAFLIGLALLAVSSQKRMARTESAHSSPAQPPQIETPRTKSTLASQPQPPRNKAPQPESTPSSAAEPPRVLQTFDTSDQMAMFFLSANKTTWALIVQHGDPQYPPKSREAIVSDLRKTDSPYRDACMSLFSGTSFPIIGDTEPVFLSQKDDVPVSVVRYKGKPCTLLVMGIDTVYNTIKLNAKERAGHVAGQVIFPAMEKIDAAFKRADVEYYALFVVYGSKDFLNDKSGLNLEPEMLGFIASKKNVEDYLSTKITDVELATSGDFFLSQQDPFFSFKKISVTPE